MSGYIAVDLDGTLAEYFGFGDGSIGKPIPAMMARIHKWLAEGKEVKIFTARVTAEEQRPVVQAWLDEHGIGHLEITNVKTFACLEIWDDRAVRVMPNTGEPCCYYERVSFTKNAKEIEVEQMLRERGLL